MIAFMRREELERLICESPEVGLRLVDLFAERLRLMDERMSDVIHKEVPARLASLILQLLDSEGVVSSEGYEIAGPYTYEELGTMIGAKRVAVTRAFKRLREEGAVEVERGRIRVKDVDALEASPKNSASSPKDRVNDCWSLRYETRWLGVSQDTHVHGDVC